MRHLICAFLLLHLCTAAFASEHFCQRIMSGQFNEVILLSFTFDTPHKFQFYERSPQDAKNQPNMYRFLQASMQIQADSLDLTSVKQSTWSDGEYQTVAARVLSTEIKAIYLMKFYHKVLPEIVSGPEQGFHAITNNREYMFDIIDRSLPRERWITEDLHAEYSIIAEQQDYAVFGYIFSRDVYDDTGFFVMYDLKMEYNDNLQIKVLAKKVPTAEERTDARFFFLEMGNTYNEAVLVHRLEGSVAEYQLFKKLPKGFLYRSTMVLFDDDLGCVHILSFNLQSLNDLYLMSTSRRVPVGLKSIPFEEYFKCDEAQFPKTGDFNSSRCKVVKKPIPPTTKFTGTVPTSETDQTTSQDLTEGGSMMVLIAAIGGAGIFVLLLLSVCCICIVKKKKPKKSRRPLPKRHNKRPTPVVSQLSSTGAASSAANSAASAAASSRYPSKAFPQKTLPQHRRSPAKSPAPRRGPSPSPMASFYAGGTSVKPSVYSASSANSANSATSAYSQNSTFSKQQTSKTPMDSSLKGLSTNWTATTSSTSRQRGDSRSKNTSARRR